MITLFVLSTVLAGALGRPGYLHGHVLAPVVTPVEISSQFHAQDTLGQYTYGYAAPLSAKSESRSVDGITRGGYTYVDAEGKVQSVQYTADAANGFRVAASNLPVAPAAPEIKPQEAPKPVEDTVEVAKARADHLAAVEEAKAREASAPADESKESSSDDADSQKAVTSVPASTVSISAPVVTGIVSQPVSYYSYAAVAPAYHYSAVAPTVHTVGYAPLVYNGLHLEDVNVARARAEHAVAHLEAKARLFAAGALVH